MALRSVTAFAAAHPWAFGCGGATVKTAVCDVMVQMQLEGKSLEEVDARRVAIFTTFGFGFLGCWQYVLFVKVMPRLFPGVEAFAAKPLREKLADRAGLRAVAGQVALENLVNNAVLYFSCFYTVQALIEDRPLLDGLRRFRDNFGEDLPAIWAWWVPVQTFNFTFSPLWMRVPVTTAASFVWTTYVSFSRGGRDCARD